MFISYVLLYFRSRCIMIVCLRKHEFRMYVVMLIITIIIVIIAYLFDLYHHFFLYNCFIYKSYFNISIKYDICIVVCPLLFSEDHDKNTLLECVELSFSYDGTYFTYMDCQDGQVEQ